MGAPKGNKNGQKHGARALGFPLVKLPADCKYINDRLCLARQTLIDAVIAKYGSLSIDHEIAIERAVSYEQGRQSIGKSKRT